MDKLKDKILKEYEKGNIVFAGVEGLQATPIKEFIKQPLEGILYDLNRNEVVVLTFLPDPKWINDYAVSKVITELKKRIEELDSNKVFEFWYTDCIHESAGACISLHRTKKSAEMAMEFHKEEERKMWLLMYPTKEEQEEMAFGSMEAWGVSERTIIDENTLPIDINTL